MAALPDITNTLEIEGIARIAAGLGNKYVFVEDSLYTLVVVNFNSFISYLD